jgi:hypothetical protein
MRVATMFPAPLAVSFTGKYVAGLIIYRTVLATRRTIMYTIHGTSSAGLPYKGKKLKKNLQELF